MFVLLSVLAKTVISLVALNYHSIHESQSVDAIELNQAVVDILLT